MGNYDRFSKNLRRLQGYDYSWEGLYFITICTKNRYPFFGQVVDGEIQLSAEGLIAQDCWLQIPKHFAHVYLGPSIIMPNHIHGILGIEYLPDAPAPVASLHCKDVVPNEAKYLPADQLEKASNTPSPIHQHMTKISPKAGSLSRIISAYKAACTTQIRRCHSDHFKEPFTWQPRFHDHVIRSQLALQKIETYILSNAETWTEDCFYR